MNMNGMSHLNTGMQGGYVQSHNGQGMTNGHPSCMSPRGHLPSYMGTTNQFDSQYGQPAMMTQSTLSPTHPGSMIPTGAGTVQSSAAASSPISDVSSELRSSSIAALRLKAKEHMTATAAISSVNMIGAYS